MSKKLIPSPLSSVLYNQSDIFLFSFKYLIIILSPGLVLSILSGCARLSNDTITAFLSSAIFLARVDLPDPDKPVIINTLLIPFVHVSYLKYKSLFLEKINDSDNKSLPSKSPYYINRRFRECFNKLVKSFFFTHIPFYLR